MESAYHYMWKHRMFGHSVTATTGRRIDIVSPGRHNRDAGPDFSAAVIRYDNTDWGGNVEIHVKASDWKRHGHHTDPAYDSVILHVVGVDDEKAARTDGSEIMQVCVAPPPEFYNRYAALTDSDVDTPACLPWIETIPMLNRTDWISSLGIERLHDKASYMKDVLESTGGDWQHTIFILMARALGFGLNGVPFELLAKSLPLNFVMRHRDNPLQIEAMVFGQAGFLEPGYYEYDEYYTRLCREYEFLKKKYSLAPLKASIWKYARTRPGNFPHRRMAILSTMLKDGMQLFADFLEAAGNYDTLMELLDFSVSEYWHTHARFGDPGGSPQPASLSRSSKEIILINVMAPFYFAYGSLTGDIDLAEKGLDLLNGIKGERNFITGLWERHGLKAKTAFDSQALINLRRNYCEKSRCLECRFGHHLLRNTIENEKTTYTAE